jgi:hypothetical protein
MRGAVREKSWKIGFNSEVAWASVTPGFSRPTSAKYLCPSTADSLLIWMGR